MLKTNNRETVGALFLIAVGSYVVINATTTLPVGTLSRMGPGLFPTMMGSILIFLGLSILLVSFFKTQEFIKINVSSLLVVCFSMIVFATMILPFGLAPAIVALVLTLSLADRNLSIYTALRLSIVLALGAALLFSYILGLQIKIINWPW